MRAARELVQQAACLALLISALSVTSLPLEGDRACWGQQRLRTEGPMGSSRRNLKTQQCQEGAEGLFFHTCIKLSGASHLRGFFVLF